MIIDEKAIHTIVEKAKKYDELAFLSKTKLISCSFCGTDQSNVNKLVAGINVFICNECVEKCVEILEEKINQEES